MNAINFRNSKGNMFIFFLIIFSLASCSKKIQFTNSAVVPAAQGYVKIEKDNNRNFLMEVKIINLANPQRLQPPKPIYVVWMETENTGTKNIGQLKIISSYFSNNLEGILKAVTPFKPARFFITAEQRADIQFPGMQVVLKTNTF
ncbi:hypothetical protein AAKU52_000416 [Pedobacter sp. CG_S7]|uniref:hypothetical protein n=1 Tax=Pedobacter sp. CG_S7 TaxID=3143930 RepID=UPI00339764A7